MNTAHRCPALLGTLWSRANKAIAQLETWLTPLFDLAIRLYVGQVFLRSGLLKLRDWDSTIALFTYDYHVPLLPTHVAAVMGSCGEVLLPPLLMLGLAGRFAAAGLTVVNIMAVLSFPELNDYGLQDHILWGSLLAVLVFHGPGKLSVDRLVVKRCGPSC